MAQLQSGKLSQTQDEIFTILMALTLRDERRGFSSLRNWLRSPRSQDLQNQALELIDRYHRQAFDELVADVENVQTEWSKLVRAPSGRQIALIDHITHSLKELRNFVDAFPKDVSSTPFYIGEAQPFREVLVRCEYKRDGLGTAAPTVNKDEVNAAFAAAQAAKKATPSPAPVKAYKVPARKKLAPKKVAVKRVAVKKVPAKKIAVKKQAPSPRPPLIKKKTTIRRPAKKKAAPKSPGFAAFSQAVSATKKTTKRPRFIKPAMKRPIAPLPTNRSQPPPRPSPAASRVSPKQESETAPAPSFELSPSESLQHEINVPLEIYQAPEHEFSAEMPVYELSQLDPPPPCPVYDGPADLSSIEPAGEYQFDYIDRDWLSDLSEFSAGAASIVQSQAPENNSSRELAMGLTGDIEASQWIQYFHSFLKMARVSWPLELPDVVASESTQIQLKAADLATRGESLKTLGPAWAKHWCLALLYSYAGDEDQADTHWGRTEYKLPRSLKGEYQRDRLVVDLTQGRFHAAKSRLQSIINWHSEWTIFDHEDYDSWDVAGFDKFGLRLRVWESLDSPQILFLPFDVDAEAIHRELGALKRSSHEAVAGFCQLNNEDLETEALEIFYDSHGQALLSEATGGILGEVEDSIRTLARGLAALHQAGCTHGAISLASIECRSLSSPIRWTAMRPGARNPSQNRAVTEDDDILAFAQLALKLFKSSAATQFRSASDKAFLKILNDCCSFDLSQRRQAFARLVSERQVAYAMTRSESTPTPRGQSTKRSRQSLQRALQILQCPKSVDEARLQGSARSTLDQCMRVLKECGDAPSLAVVQSLMPASGEQSRRHSMLHIPAGTVTRPDGQSVEVPAFLIEREQRPHNQLSREQAEQVMNRGQLQLPSLEQWLRVLDVKPEGFKFSVQNREWLRQRRREGRRVLARAVGLNKHRGRYVVDQSTMELAWLPAHCPGEGITARGVISLH